MSPIEPQHLRRPGDLADIVADWEREHGAFTDADLSAARARLGVDEPSDLNPPATAP